MQKTDKIIFIFFVSTTLIEGIEYLGWGLGLGSIFKISTLFIAIKELLVLILLFRAGRKFIKTGIVCLLVSFFNPFSLWLVDGLILQGSAALLIRYLLPLFLVIFMYIAFQDWRRFLKPNA